MILLDLRCNQGHVFEGWFHNGESYSKQIALKLVNCPYCSSGEVEKAPIAPALLPTIRASRPTGNEIISLLEGINPSTLPVQAALRCKSHDRKLMEIVQQLRTELDNNYMDVGDKFAEEARKMHYGEKEYRNIFGRTTAEEAQRLREEGIDCFIMPTLPKHNS